MKLNQDKNKTTQTELHAWMRYDPITGIFRRRQSTTRWLAGEKIGTVRSDGYLATRFNGKMYMMHQLAFLYMEGHIPDNIDHRDRDRANNAWSNLRAGDDLLNARNRGVQKNNSTGVSGVSYRSNRRVYDVRITNDKKKRVHVGTYDKLIDAVIARHDAELKYWGFTKINLQDWI